ncbi:hypothetical protein DESUT3_18140 [Desulfuromonas versatilis]|uniref:Mannosyl-glycoprotein endo-beta-N-acetylglucosamidase-like domain-containing protein n=1 Tax=Desulfuromonas versatilis TaxID=2802975 RepID=A0ABM8HW46_9BACT|nr:glucosaminidase domain-containing protein [Desulfuromonas versatilis]BCR04745.1 hypothetical protein DESUT3_18140 [Desulfuromonas versatilis]
MNTSLGKQLAALLLCALITLGGCQQRTGESPPQETATGVKPVEPQKVLPRSHRELHDIFLAHNYDWDTLTEGVPPIVLEELPRDLGRITQIKDRKRIFFLSLLPLVLMANEEISAQREKVLEICRIHDAGEQLSDEQLETIEETLFDYKVDGDPLNDRAVRSNLLKRLDVIPPALALAQAATESAYGTSRFARMANNLFGEWTFIPGTGLVPEDRPEGETYEVRRFPSLYDSVRSYMRNINTHWAYHSLREARARQRAQERPLRGMDLAQGLRLYSARKEAYVEEIRAIISRNRLTRLASTFLRGTADEPEPPLPEEEPIQAGLFSTGNFASRNLALATRQPREE